ncbi:hypothetical protein BpHYR1_047986 [Brachionus plicatilis]|uniref:Uncharacterized protein n=1 Tax=Brachionus plicatilis TaxID=10195 RepID=A0A3M7R5S8_BRAPC|nr:hypothetical protein BpHYR1_047986 [Brachionus plicatilis]
MTQSCPNISLTQFKKPIRDCYLMMHDVGGNLMEQNHKIFSVSNKWLQIVSKKFPKMSSSENILLNNPDESILVAGDIFDEVFVVTRLDIFFYLNRLMYLAGLFSIPTYFILVQLF